MINPTETTDGAGAGASRPPRSLGRRIGRILPPVVVLGLAVLLVVRLAGDPDRLASRRRIGERTATVADIDHHLDLYGAAPEDRDAAAKAYLRRDQVAKAITAVFGNLRAPADPARARGFAETALLHLGWTVPERFEEPRRFAPLALVALCDGGHPEALALLGRIAAGPIQEAIPYYFAAYQRGTRPTLDVLVPGFRNAEALYHSPAAAAAMRPEPYPERQKDLAVLLEAVQGTLRQVDRVRWVTAVLALGRSEEPEAAAVLRDLTARFGSSENPRDAEDAALTAVGLVALGDWSEEERILARIGGIEPTGIVVGWYAQAVVWRDGRGDAAARDRLRRLWYETPQPFVTELRTAMASRLFLQDRPAVRDALYDAFVRDLVSPESRVIDQVVGHAVRLRRGESEAIQDLLRLLKTPEGSMISEPSTAQAPHAAHPWITGMRAIYLYTPGPAAAD